MICPCHEPLVFGHTARSCAITAVIRELRELRADVGEHAAVLAEWTAHIPAGRVPARARLALAELQRLSASTGSSAGDAHPPRPTR